MSSPFGAYDWPLGDSTPTTPNPGIHTPPPAPPPAIPPITIEDLIEFGFKLIEGIIRRIVLAVDGFFPGAGEAFEALTSWADDVRAQIAGIAQTIIDAWNGIPSAIGGLFGQMWDAVTGILGVGQDAAATANNAMREITAIRGELQAGGDGESYPENLDYANAAYLPAPYVVYENGPGGGSYGPNGNSALDWKQSGFSNRFCGYRRPTPMFSAGKFGCAMIIEQKAVNNGPAAYLGAVDASGNGIAMGVQQSAVSLNPVTAGIPGAALVSASPGTANGDTYEMYYGATIGGVEYPHYLVVFRNGVALFKSNDISGGVTLDTDLFAYVGGQAIGSGFVQTVPPRISSFTVFDSNYSAAA